MHPNGQIPAYEWNFSDVNPPVHAWAANKVFEIDGRTDFTFLARIFHKLLINFTWWVDNKDHGGNNLFQGGFMGLDNIAPLDRSALPPSEGYLEQADSTAWMAMYAQGLLEMALRLAVHNRSYEDVATKFFEHFLAIAGAANNAGLWDERTRTSTTSCTWPTGPTSRSRSNPWSAWCRSARRSPMTECRCVDLPDFQERASWFLDNHPEYRQLFHTRDIAGRRHRLLALVPPERLIRLLDNVFEDDGLLSDYGIRAISAWHREHPFSVEVGGIDRVRRLRTRRIHHQPVRRELQLARADLDAAERAAGGGAAQLRQPRSRRAHGGVPGRFR